MDLEIRDADAGDTLRLGEIFRRASLSNEQDRAALLDHPEALVFREPSAPSHRQRVAIVESTFLAGFATTIAQSEVLELVDLFTDPDWLRRGVATALIDDIVAFATANGVPRISVVGNPHALKFYERMGFITECRVTTELGVGLRMHRAVDL